MSSDTTAELVLEPRRKEPLRRRRASFLGLLAAALTLPEGGMQVETPRLFEAPPTGYNFAHRLPNQRQRRLAARRAGAGR